MVRVTYLTVRNGYHDMKNVSYESRNGVLHEFLSIMCCRTCFFACSGNGLEILASYHDDYTFMLRDTYI
jgi:hypothetical protein